MHANDLFETITNQLIADIEAGAAGEWRMPWHTLADAGTPTSIDNRPYRGMNALWLAMVAAARGWTSGLWGTYRAWQRHGAQVRRGEKAVQVVLWKPTTPKSTDDDTDSDGGTDRTRRPRLLARAYAVFAAEQCDGADELIARRAERLAERDTPERIEPPSAISPRSPPLWSKAATAPTTAPPPTPSTCRPSPSSTPPRTTTARAPTRLSTGPATATA